MILWVVLFALVIAISFVLALQSMHDYHEAPEHFDAEYGLFLIRNTGSFTSEVLELIHNQIVKEGLIVSLERLFRGPQSALVIFGPKNILKNYTEKLNLLELEDYTQIDNEHVTAWEVGVKNSEDASKQIQKVDNFFMNFPMLAQAEQFWWQLTLKAKDKKSSFKLPNFKTIFGKPDTQDERDYFQSQIRAVVFTQDLARRKKLSEALQNLLSGHLTKVPKPFTSNQIMEFYKNRSMGKDPTSPTLQTGEVLKLTLLGPSG